MATRLISAVSCVNDWASEQPEAFTALLDDAVIARIKALSSAVREMKAYAIEEFNYSGTWSTACFDEEEPLDGPFDQDRVDAIVKEIEKQEVSVDIPMLRVTEDSFSFTAVPKHLGDDMAIRTNWVKVSELDAPKPLIVAMN